MDATYGIFGTRIDLVDENFTQGDMEGIIYAIVQVTTPSLLIVYYQVAL